MKEIQNELETPTVSVAEEKKQSTFAAYLKEAWDKLIFPALQEFWKAHGTEVLATLKTLGLDLIKSIITKKGEIKEDKK